MIQKEVADRLIAIPGEKETGAITYAVYYYAIAEAILEVPKESFIPEPEVTSKVIKLNIRKEPPIEVQDKELMFKIIKSAFMQRRKTLINALNNAAIPDAQATLPTPPSSFVIFFSKTSMVGLLILV